MSDEPVCGVDFLPTACEIAGLDPPQNRVLDGASLLPVLAGQPIPRRTPLYWHFNLATSNGGGNLLQGDNGAPFQDDVNQPRHDVLMADNSSDYDSEGGDDIMGMRPGIQRAEGMFGFDWAIHKNDPLPADSDLFFTGLLPPTVENNRDRFDLTEAMSDWMRDDILRGDDADTALISVGHELNAAGIARIAGLADLLPTGATSFTAGNIILGGAGSDILEGRGGDDILDGDRWLEVQIRVLGTLPAGVAEFHPSGW